jgi:hypothetical protein
MIETMRGSESLSEKILVAGLFLCVTSISWSPFGTSLGMGLIALSWFISLFTKQLKAPTNRLLLASMVGLFIWHVTGLLWTENIAEGFATLQIKLPLLIVPLSLLTVKWNSQMWMDRILKAFALSVFFAAATSLILSLIKTKHGVSLHPSEWSPFISHIRMGILLAVGWGGILIYKGDKRRLVLMFYAVVAGLFIWQTQSVTGAVMVAITTVLSLQNRWRIAVLGGSFIGCFWLFFTIIPGATLTTLPTHTAWGSPYIHHTDRVLEENGNKVWSYLAWEEMRTEWNLQSKVGFNAKDSKGHEIKYTLMRYLTSKGEPKDGLAVRNLSLKDIRAIEFGSTSIKQATASGLALRLDELRFEVGNFIDGGNPSGNSVTQRWEYFKVGIYIAKNNLLFGVGTGDLPDSFEKAYDEVGTRLSPQFRHRTHNQFIAWWIGGGLIALILFILIFVFSWKRDVRTKRLGRVVWWVLAISCLAEDTFETQAGITFAVFAIVLFSLYDRRSQSFTFGKRSAAG